MSIHRKIEIARSQLLLNQPFFGQLAMRLIVREDTRNSTAWTDGRFLGYNREWIDSLTNDHVLAVTAHEIMHCVLDHITRRNSRDPKLWNVAGDYVINLILTDSGFDLPKPCLFDRAFAGMTTEAVYDKLLSDMSPELKRALESGSSDVGLMGEAVDAEGDSNEVSDDWKAAVAGAAEQARRIGKLPAGLDRLVGKLLNPQVPWQALLRDFLQEPFRSDYTWRRPNKRLAHTGLHFPSVATEHTGQIVVAVDTSGSIDDHMLTAFFSEINAIFSEVRPSALHVIYCDAAVTHVDRFEPGDPLVANPKGGGGTDFRPPFKYLDENGITPAALVYLTDLCCHSYPETPDFPVLWANWAEHNSNVPFGTIININ